MIFNQLILLHGHNTAAATEWVQCNPVEWRGVYPCVGGQRRWRLEAIK